MGKVSFYCEKCGLDQDLFAEKVSSEIFKESWYVAKCQKCGMKLHRLITYPEADKYYKLSKRVIIMRALYRKDLIQPGQEGFQLLYPRQWRKMEAELEKLEMKRRAKDDWYKRQLKKHSTDSSAKKVLHKAYELEESKL